MKVFPTPGAPCKIKFLREYMIPFNKSYCSSDIKTSDKKSSRVYSSRLSSTSSLVSSRFATLSTLNESIASSVLSPYSTSVGISILTDPRTRSMKAWSNIFSISGFNPGIMSITALIIATACVSFNVQTACDGSL